MSIISRDEQSGEAGIAHGVYIEPVGTDSGPLLGGPDDGDHVEHVDPNTLEQFIPDAAGSPRGLLDEVVSLAAYGDADHPETMAERARAAAAPLAEPVARVVTPAEVVDAQSKLSSGNGDLDLPTTKEQQDKVVAGILAANELQNINDQTLIFEYGPLHVLEKQLREFTTGIIDGPIAELVISHVRQAIHDLAVTSPGLAKSATSEVGLRSRIDVLKHIERKIEGSTSKLLDDLERACVPDMGSLKDGLLQIVSGERRLLEDSVKDLSPPTVGRLLFEAMRSVVTDKSGDQLVGNARVHRNRDLTQSLSSLKDVAAELKAHAGDAAWEKSQGKASLSEVESLTKRINGLTKGVEDQVDALALRKGFKDVKASLDDASSMSAEPGHKSALETASKAIADFVKQLTEVLSRLFTRASGPGRAPAA